MPDVLHPQPVYIPPYPKTLSERFRDLFTAPPVADHPVDPIAAPHVGLRLMRRHRRPPVLWLAKPGIALVVAIIAAWAVVLVVAWLILMGVSFIHPAIDFD